MMTLSRSVAALSLIVLVTLMSAEAACARGTRTPTSPGGGSATINGTIVSSGTGVTSVTSTGATVRVAGSDVTGSVDANQSFVLANVPAGTNVVLEFVGAGLNASVPIGSLNAGDQVVLVLTRDNAAVSIDQSSRRSGDNSQLQGRIESIIPSGRTFVVTGQTIQTDGGTQFFRSTGGAGTFTDLAIGVRVDITGTPGAQTTVVAKVVRLLDPGVDTTIRLSGLISSLTGTSTDFQFTLQGRTVRGDTTTIFAPGSSFDDLFNGGNVTVNGVTAAPFVRATSIDVR